MQSPGAWRSTGHTFSKRMIISDVGWRDATHAGTTGYRLPGLGHKVPVVRPSLVSFSELVPVSPVPFRKAVGGINSAKCQKLQTTGWALMVRGSHLVDFFKIFPQAMPIGPLEQVAQSPVILQAVPAPCQSADRVCLARVANQAKYLLGLRFGRGFGSGVCK